jgi:hypothetical protein
MGCCACLQIVNVTGQIKKKTDDEESFAIILKAMVVYVAVQTLLHSYSTLNQ